MTRVPKRDLCGVVAVLLETSRLVFAKAQPHLAVLLAELRNFRVKIDPATSHDSYAAWREKDHDDVVLAVALAAWWIEAGAPEAGWHAIARQHAEKRASP